jgi:hypothetical protein
MSSVVIPEDEDRTGDDSSKLYKGPILRTSEITTMYNARAVVG